MIVVIVLIEELFRYLISGIKIEFIDSCCKLEEIVQ